MAVGALMVDADRARAVELALESLCAATGFPPHEEFKWSPGRDTWMRTGLQGEARTGFFQHVTSILYHHGVQATFVLEDANERQMTFGLTSEQDVIVGLFERLAHRLKGLETTALVVADRPGGDRADENQFVADCIAALQSGTRYVQHDEITFVVTADSKFVRLLQAADFVTSCMTARVAGEPTWSVPQMPTLLSLFPVVYRQRAGFSIKLHHPEHKFVNLYHWVAWEREYSYRGRTYRLPVAGLPYSLGPELH